MRGKFDYSSLKRFGDDLEALDASDTCVEGQVEPQHCANGLGSMLKISQLNAPGPSRFERISKKTEQPRLPEQTSVQSMSTRFKRVTATEQAQSSHAPPSSVARVVKRPEFKVQNGTIVFAPQRIPEFTQINSSKVECTNQFTSRSNETDPQIRMQIQVEFCGRPYPVTVFRKESAQDVAMRLIREQKLDINNLKSLTYKVRQEMARPMAQVPTKKVRCQVLLETVHSQDLVNVYEHEDVGQAAYRLARELGYDQKYVVQKIRQQLQE